MDHILKPGMLGKFEIELIQSEKSHATIKKYLRDMKRFLNYVGDDRSINKETVISYKQYLSEHYAISSANSMLASLNSFLEIMGWSDCKVRVFKTQREAFRPEDRELTRDEYMRLLKAAKKEQKLWLYMIMLTICSTGIRISELSFITVESLNTRRAKVSLKGKTRTVILSVDLCRELKRYARSKKIRSGSIFVTRNGKPIDRCNIYHAMKKLSQESGVEQSKIFPHNLRHLFAVTYYRRERDISHLADLLGHSNINTTRIYTLTSGVEQERQINELGLVI